MMKTLIVCDSREGGNTRRIAEAFAKFLDAPVVSSAQARVERIREFDLVGFGSGIFGGRHGKELLAFIDRLPFGEGQKAFIFSTGWMGLARMEKNHRLLREKLEAKGYKITGQFSCKGSVRRLGVNLMGKGHPDAEELELARMFAEGVGSGK